MSAARWWSVALVAIVVFSIPTDCVLFVARQPEVGTGAALLRFASFFTIQSNLLVLVSVVPLISNPRFDSPAWRVARLNSLLGITVTGLVFAIVLAPFYKPVGLAWWTNIGMHYASPILTLSGWLLFGQRGFITWKVLGLGLIWPTAWVAWTLIHGAMTGWYPYGFLDVGALGYSVALINLGAIVLFAFALLFVFRVIDSRLDRRKSSNG